VRAAEDEQGGRRGHGLTPMRAPGDPHNPRGATRAPARHLPLALGRWGLACALEVRDNRPGFDVAVAYRGLGLQNTRDRLGPVRGTVGTSSESCRGTLVVATAPVRRDS
jgi:signal transduction histidine kinase